jgi:hypothetical protein
MELRERFLSACQRRLGGYFDVSRNYISNMSFREIDVELVLDGQKDLVTINGPGYSMPEGSGYRGVEAVLEELQAEGIKGAVVRRLY